MSSVREKVARNLVEPTALSPGVTVWPKPYTCSLNTPVAPRASFEERFPAYRGWLLRKLGREEAKKGARNAQVAALEKAHGLLLEERFQSAEAVTLPEAEVARLLEQ